MVLALSKTPALFQLAVTKKPKPFLLLYSVCRIPKYLQ